MSEVKDRLVEFLKFEKISQKKFADKVGVSTGFVNAIRVSISPSTLSKIQSCYPKLNIEWLITGEGDMLKPQPEVVTEADDSSSQCNDEGGHDADDDNSMISKIDAKKILDELAALRHDYMAAIERRDSQIDRLITLLEKK